MLLTVVGVLLRHIFEFTIYIHVYVACASSAFIITIFWLKWLRGGAMMMWLHCFGRLKPTFEFTEFLIRFHFHIKSMILFLARSPVSTLFFSIIIYYLLIVQTVLSWQNPIKIIIFANPFFRSQFSNWGSCWHHSPKTNEFSWRVKEKKTNRKSCTDRLKWSRNSFPAI